MTKTFPDKVALVTGGGSGIGRATALAFAGEGARTAVADLNRASAESTVADIREKGGFALALEVDVTQAEQAQAMVADTLHHFGGLDYAVNNAGIGGVHALTADYPEDVWHKVIEVDLTGVWLCMKYEIPAMLERGGAIVNISSAAGLGGFRGHAAYAAAKHGVVGLTQTAALDYARAGIRINALCPSFTDTPMVNDLKEQEPKLGRSLEKLIPMGRLGTPWEIARSILFLCSPGAGFINGAALPVDGGLKAL